MKQLSRKETKMNKEKYNQDHTTTFMVVYVTANKINAAFTNCDRIRFNSFALTDNSSHYDVYKMLTEEMAESLVSEVVLVDYVKEIQTNNTRQYADIGEMQMVVEFACAELQIPFQVISFEEATKYANGSRQTSDESCISNDDNISTNLSEYYKKLNEINKHKSVAVYTTSNTDALNGIDFLTQDTYMGVVYALKYGNMVKIGSSKHPYKRFIALKSQAEKYGNIKVGDIAISGLHTNFRENEKIAHHKFQKFRKEGTELFNIDFETVKDYLNTLELLDETIRINQDSETFKNGMANLLFVGELQHLDNPSK